MPIYGYRCSSCGRDIDVIHAIDALGPTTCEVCGGSMRKTLSTPAIHFKGGGWAKKDAHAGSSSGKAAAKADHEQAVGSATVSDDAGPGAATPAAKGDAASSGGPAAGDKGSSARPPAAAKGDARRGGGSPPVSGSRPARSGRTQRTDQRS